MANLDSLPWRLSCILIIGYVFPVRNCAKKYCFDGVGRGLYLDLNSQKPHHFAR
jgi:hypothetical protein